MADYLVEEIFSNMKSAELEAKFREVLPSKENYTASYMEMQAANKSVVVDVNKFCRCLKTFDRVCSRVVTHRLEGESDDECS